MNLFTYPVQSKDVQFNQTETTLVTAALALRSKERNEGVLSVGHGGDQVDISPEAKALASSQGRQDQGQGEADGQSPAVAQAAQSAKENGESADVGEQARQRIQERIQEIQRELRQVQADAKLSQEEKDKRVQQLQTELMTLMSELQQQGGGQGYTGGTAAQGMAQSLT